MFPFKKTANALFIIPPFSDFYISDDRLYPNNVVLISKILKNFGIKTAIVDFRFGYKKSTKIPEDLSYLKDFYKKDYTKFSLFNDYNYYGIFQQKHQIIFFDKFCKIYTCPDIILISSNFTAYRNHVINLVESILKYFKKSIYLIIGGNDVVLDPDYYKNNIYKFILKYSLESKKIIIYDNTELNNFINIIKEINKGFQNKIKNTKRYFPSSILKKKKKFKNKTFSFFYLDKIFYFNLSKNKIFAEKPIRLYKKGSILFSIGCPFKCSYCFYSNDKFKNFYYRSLDEITKDLLALKVEEFKEINVEDDSFTANKSESINILKLLESFNKKIFKFSYNFPNGLNYHTIDDILLQYFKNANINNISISLGSVNLSILKKFNRPSSIDEFEDFIDNTGKYDIKLIAYIIAGFYGQSFFDVVDSFLYLFEKNINVGFSPYYPVLNSKDYYKYNLEDQLKKYNFNERYFAASSLFSFDNCLTTSEKATLFKIYRILSFLHHKKLKEKFWVKNIYYELDEFINKNRLDDQIFLKMEDKIEISIYKESINYLESFIYINFLRSQKILVLSEKESNKDKAEFLKLKFEIFPSDEKISYFHKKISKFF